MRLRRLLLAGLAASLLALTTPSLGAGATTVTTTDDHDDGFCNADCTLREALLHLPAGSTITVPAGHYLLGSALATTVNDTIAGAGAKSVTIDGQNQGQVFDIQGGTLDVSGVTVTGGSAGSGGGFFVTNGATLSLTDSRVTGNAAISRGGGIYSEGRLVINRSAIDTNRIIDGAGGGGIAVQTPVSGTSPGATLTNVTISDNDGQGSGGGILIGAPLTLLNVTFAGNQATSGGSTSGGPLQADDTIFTKGIAPVGVAPVACDGSPVITGSHNLADDKTCAGATVVPDPKLGALNDNGGGTPTRALLAGSPAIDTGAGCAPRDQRGVTRPQGPACDIGAFEVFVAPPPTPTPTPTPIPTPTPTPPGPPPPVYNQSFNAFHSRGVVKYRLPHHRRYVLLTEGVQLPKGTLLDTTKGRVTLYSADKQNKTQHAWFYEGIFKLAGQTKGRKPITLLNLAGPKPQCGTLASKSSAQIARRRRSRHLWGSGKGRFRTTGQFSSATVRGTIWLTQDSCKGTLVKVKRGIVAVDDFTLHKTFLVKAGHRHLAKRRG